MKTMLKVALASVVVLLMIVGAFVIWRLWATYAGGRDAYLALTTRIAPVEERLQAKQDPEPADLERFARDPATRKVLYDALDHHGRLSLFPPAYLTPEAMAEADLVLWLAHPNELAATPDEIQLMKVVPPPGEAYARKRYFVFRYRTKPPHWAAQDGWLAGVAGPYPEEGPFPPEAAGTFSRFEAYDSRTPEEHVRVTHEAVMGGR
jgi:hypothetical protein